MASPALQAARRRSQRQFLQQQQQQQQQLGPGGGPGGGGGGGAGGGPAGLGTVPEDGRGDPGAPVGPTSQRAGGSSQAQVQSSGVHSGGNNHSQKQLQQAQSAQSPGGSHRDKIVEIFEVEERRGMSIPGKKLGTGAEHWRTPSASGSLPRWTARDGRATLDIEEIEAPPHWVWVSNWRIDDKRELTDKYGWEYGSRFERIILPPQRIVRTSAISEGSGGGGGGSVRGSAGSLGSFGGSGSGDDAASTASLSGQPPTQRTSGGRPQRATPNWNDKVRRRRWVRLMRHKTNLRDPDEHLLNEASAKLQVLHRTRLKLAGFVQMLGTEQQSEEMQNRLLQFIEAVQLNIDCTKTVLSQMHSTTKVNKLWKDLANEEGDFRDIISEPRVTRMLRDSARSSTDSRGLAHSRGHSDEFVRDALARRPNPWNLEASGAPGEAGSSSPSSAMMSAAAATDALMARSAGGDATASGRSSPDSMNSAAAAAVAAADRAAADMGVGRGAVTSGARGAFDPSTLGSGNRMNGAAALAEGEDADGYFVDREQILQKLQAEDESVITVKIMQERADAVQDIQASMTELNETFRDFQTLVGNQQEHIDNICMSVEVANDRVEDAYEDIVRADQHHREATACTIS